MQTLSLMAVEISLLKEGFTVAGGWLSWLTKFIEILITGVGITGVGIILFTLILKAVVLPFDIYQRVNSRKQTLIMRNMKPELDKLQKQYANDKSAYSQKMMELYKKNGYSMFGACLPMLLSLLILIFAFQSLNEFSQSANLKIYDDMAHAYNQAILSHHVSEADIAENPALGVIDTTNPAEVKVVANAADKFVYIVYQTGEKDANGNEIKKYKYFIDTDKMWAHFATVEGSPLQAYYDARVAQNANYAKETACLDFMWEEIGADAAMHNYRDNKPYFLWIKNIWYADVSYESPIQDYDSFVSSISSDIVYNGVEGEIKTVIDQTTYERLTMKLTEEKDQANGYFILIVLSIGMMVLSQFITMKSSKEASKYQSVDGSGVNQQKIMLVMMPLIYAIFAFMYSAAFSIYMTMSSVLSILVTVFTNLILDRIFRKKEEAELKKQYSRKLPWMKDDAKDKNKNKDKRKK